MRIFTLLTLSLVIQISGLSSANATVTATDTSGEAVTSPESAPQLSTPENPKRKRWTITGNYSTIDMLMPSKWGASLAYNEPTVSYELEYMRGALGLAWLGLDIGGITEQRFTLLLRSFSGRESFNFSYGVSYTDFVAKLGNRYLSTVTANNISEAELFKVSNLSLVWGLGNRWQLSNGFTFGADWFGLHIPVAALEGNTSYIDLTTDDDNRDDLKLVRNLIEKIPRLVVLKFQLGMSF